MKTTKAFCGRLAAVVLFLCATIPVASTAAAKDSLPDADTIMGWISEIESRGIRLPGYEADIWVEQWAAEQFRSFGLQEVELDPIDAGRWQPLSWSLEIWHTDNPDNIVELSAWPVPLSRATDGLEGELALADDPDADIKGHIAVKSLELLSRAQSDMRDNLATWAYDPEGVFGTLEQTWPLGPRFQGTMDPEIAAGAIGFIGILNFPWETDHWYVPYDDKLRDIPGLYVSRSQGTRLRNFMAEGPTRARLKVNSDYRRVTSHNVIGTLPGKSDHWIVIGSHHDGPWHSAVEDASGVAMVLAQARYWSRIPAEQRPHNLLFLLTGGHMSNSAGQKHFVRTRNDFVRNDLIAEIHLEHAAREAAVEDGKLVPTDQPKVRWWFTSHTPKLENIVARAICAQDLKRSLMMPMEGFPRPQSKHPPTDGSAFHPDAPIVSFLTAPVYLFSPEDRLNMVHEPSLEPVSRAVIDIVNDLGAVGPAELRAEVYEPPRADPVPGCDGL